ncbi:hypothetical protein EYB31_04550 [Paenibacillus thalictri]|uniref:Uncharacterized protein n=1 Tax=Paenibacillus thalictri TaxID=2527873 RepID=A0A4Q9DY83_9BACL|nr:hypothetical protein EYB31_04550 [Paenibacillus thalictri]
MDRANAQHSILEGKAAARAKMSSLLDEVHSLLERKFLLRAASFRHHKQKTVGRTALLTVFCIAGYDYCRHDHFIHSGALPAARIGKQLLQL